MAAPSAGLEAYNHETDRRALRALFGATGGAGWKKKNGWEDNSDDLSTWHGVSVKPSSGRVFALIMRKNGLNGALTSDIWDLTELEHLDFGENRLRGEIPPIPENRMEKLYVFNVNFNRITGNLPDLHLLPSLEEAYFDVNRFTGSISENIGRCQKLRKLFVSSNKLEGKLPSSLGKLVNMTKLKISDNGFSGVIPEEFANMSKLRDFKVDYNTELTKPGNARVRSRFNQWTHDRKLENDLADLPFASSNDEHTGIPGEVGAFPGKDDQGMLVEGPLRTRDSDCLGFADYAEVLANRLQDPAAWPVGLGIYAQWGAGKSSLCEMIIQELLKTKKEKTAQKSWFIRWLWRTAGGAALYALTKCLVSAITERCCHPANSAETDKSNGDEGKCCPGLLMFGRCCGSSESDMSVDNAENGVGTSVSSNPASFTVKTIVASFDAWLFADSKVLWAILVSKIFDVVEEHFGKGAVRATRVHHAVSSSTCMDWCTIGFTTVIVMCVAAAVVWIAEQIDHIEEQAERVAAGVALAGVPTAIVLLVIKALPVVFKSQGEVILSKAKAMGESVGAAHLGFMAEVQDEMQVLLGMLKSKSSEDVKYLLVVSIDNLDRCPHRQIIRVLEAVHLLLEHNAVNVAVILALDPRLIIAAIEKDMGDSMCREVSGSEYLDKIIHWPFCIPGGTKQERTSLLHNWLQTQELRRRASNPMLPVQGEEEAKASEGPAYDDKTPQSKHGRGNRSLTSGDEGDAEADEKSAYEDREPHPTPTRRDISLAPSGGDDDLDNATELFKSTPPFSSAAASVSEQGSHMDTPSTTTTGAWTSQRLARQTSYRTQTSAEVTELERMITKAATTPRKAKRVCNIYSIQRELAIRRAKKMGLEFTSDDALKLLRWTIMSEFWPFHTACLAAIIPREESDRNQRKHTTLQTLFNVEGGEFLENISGGKGSAGNATGEAGDQSSTDFDSSSRIAARRLIGMDEEYEGFSQLLGSHPKLSVADFEEDKLGLLRLSINLNPAMVAKEAYVQQAKVASEFPIHYLLS